MGFRPEPKQYRLTFDGTELDGLEVVMGSVSVREFNEMIRLSMANGISEEAIAANDRVLELFAQHIVSWNLEDAKGKPVKTDLETVLGTDRSIIGQVVTGWQVALVTVPNPSKGDSPNGEISPSDLEALAASSSPGS